MAMHRFYKATFGMKLSITIKVSLASNMLDVFINPETSDSDITHIQIHKPNISSKQSIRDEVSKEVRDKVLSVMNNFDGVDELSIKMFNDEQSSVKASYESLSKDRVINTIATDLEKLDWLVLSHKSCCVIL